MLVLSRRQGERIIIGEEIEVTVLEIHGNRVKLGVRGPAEVPIRREELLRTLEAASRLTEAHGLLGLGIGF